MRSRFTSTLLNGPVRCGFCPTFVEFRALASSYANRLGYLLNAVSSRQYQSLITTTDLAGFDPKFLERATLLQVRQGEVLAMEAAS